MTALENAKKIEELGGCTKISAPTPSTRFPHSEITPEVRPTIIKTRTTWMAIAITLREERRRRAEMLPQNICSKEKGPSKESFIVPNATLSLELRTNKRRGRPAAARHVPNRLANIS